MTTPPSDPYGTPPRDGDDHEASGLPSFPGESAAPVPPPGYGQPPAQPEPPASILTAVKLMYVGAGLTALWIVVQLAGGDAAREQLESVFPDMSQDELDATASGATFFTALVGAIALGMWLWMAHVNRKGRLWGRIVATVLGVIGILAAVLNLLTFTLVNLVLNVGLLAVVVGILVLLYRAESSAYYHAASNQPRY